MNIQTNDDTVIWERIYIRAFLILVYIFSFNIFILKEIY